MTQGDRTGQFGAWLTAHVKEHGLPLRVFYDHGDSGEANVGEIQGTVGTEARRENILSHVDIMVVDLHGDIKLLAEIEDKAVMEPKKLIGTAIANLLCDRFAFGTGEEKRYYPVAAHTHYLLVGVLKEKGSKNRQLHDVIIPRLHELRLPEGGLQMENVRFVFENTIEDAIGKLKMMAPELLR